MSEIVTFRQISFDSAHITQPHQGFGATFFQPAPYPFVDGSTRVTEFDERTIIHWLLLCPASRHVLLETLGLPPDAFYQSAVVQPFYAPGEGDLDLILCPRLTPHEAVAIECKRVKVETVNVGEDRVNKLQDAARGVCQANRLYNGPFAFFQTYLAIITEVAASLQHETNIPNRGVRSHTKPQSGDTKNTTFRQIVEFPGRAELHNEIGILFIEIVQPSRLSIDTQATARVCIYRRAEKRDQLDSVTNRVTEIMK
jgi:hypothetical protein